MTHRWSTCAPAEGATRMRTIARRSHAIGALFALASAVLTSAARTDADALDDHCVISILNRSVEVKPDGSWILPNVPANIGRVRARATCVRDGITTSGQSDYFLIPANGVVNDVPPIVFDSAAPIPARLSVSAPDTPLRGDGATVQLTVNAIYPSGQTADITAAAKGTNYTSSNPAIASVSADGLVTAHSSGNILMTALNDGATGLLQLSVLLSSDTDGDGIPDDYEISHDSIRTMPRTHSKIRTTTG